MPRPGIPKKLTLRKLWVGESHIPHSRSLERARKGCLRTDRDHVAGRESLLPSRTSVAGVGTKDQSSDEKDGLDSPESNPSTTIPTCFDRIDVRVGGLEEWERRGVLLGTKGADGETLDSLVVEPKNAWAERVGKICWNAGGARETLERKREKLGSREKSQFQLFLFLLCGSLHARVRPCPYILLGELVGGPESKSPPSLLFSNREREFHGGWCRVGRDGTGEGTTGCGWRKRKGKGRRR